MTIVLYLRFSINSCGKCHLTFRPVSPLSQNSLVTIHTYLAVLYTTGMDESNNSNLDKNLKAYEQLQQDREALQAEYKLSLSDPLTARQSTKDNVTLLGADAVETLGNLMRTSESDAIRLRASQFVVGTILDMDKSQDADDALTKLLTKLTC